MSLRFRILTRGSNSHDADRRAARQARSGSEHPGIPVQSRATAPFGYNPPFGYRSKAVKYSYERLEFLGDSILGAIVATIAFDRFHDLDEGGLTRIKVALVSGASLSEVAERLGFTDVIVFGSSETGTGRRGLHSALENVYEAVVAALFLDGGMGAAVSFVRETLIPRMSVDMAKEPENPKSALQEKLQEDGITLRTSWWKRRAAA